MQHVSSRGGPRILLPTGDVERWIDELGEEPTPGVGLYGLACSINDYCGIIRPWDTPLLIFGDDPSNIYWLPNEDGGLFVRWVGADSLDQLTAFASSVADAGNWTEHIEWDAQFINYTLMDTCTFIGDDAPRIAMTIAAGKYVVESQYAEAEAVMAIVQNLRHVK
jgi:hypothetical protein